MDNKLPFDQKDAFRNAVINKISLHGSLSIGFQLGDWMERVMSLQDLLLPYMSNVIFVDSYNVESQIPTSELTSVTYTFTQQFDSLKVSHAEILVKMREELHPTD